jgi:hypothetical protein
MQDLEYIEHLEALVGLWTAIAALHGESVPDDMQAWAIKQCKNKTVKAASSLALTYAVMNAQKSRAAATCSSQ